MPDLDPQMTTLAVDTQLGGDAAMPGLANSVTADEITDIYSNPQRPVAERQEALQHLRQEMIARASADLRDDSKALIAKIDEGLAYLKEGGNGFADPDVLRLRDTAVDPTNL